MICLYILPIQSSKFVYFLVNHCFIANFKCGLGHRKLDKTRDLELRSLILWLPNDRVALWPRGSTGFIKPDQLRKSAMCNKFKHYVASIAVDFACFCQFIVFFIFLKPIHTVWTT